MKKEPRYLVIPAAGMGTRMKGVNSHLPKELLPLGDKPAIQYAVDEGISAGIKDIIIIINKQKEIIRQYFEERNQRENIYPLMLNELDRIKAKCSISFLYQKEPLGESNAIALAEDLIGKESFAIIYPDNIYFPTPGALKILKNIYHQYRIGVIALMEVNDENLTGVSNSGRVDLTPQGDGIFRIKCFHPKDQGTFRPRFKGELRACGISITGPHFFEYIRKASAGIKSAEFTDGPVRNLELKEKGLLGCRLPGTVFDTGNPKGYALCQENIFNDSNT